MVLLKFFIPLLLLLNIGCGHLFYAPDNKRIFFPPEKNGYSPTDVEFKSSDGTLLHGWHIKTKKPFRGTIVQFHGNAQNISSHYVALAWLTRLGYDLFIFDYRGYGKSKGVAHREGIYLDSQVGLLKGWELHQKRLNTATKKRKCGKKDSHFIVFGQSLGGIISARAIYDFKHRDQVTLLVQDSTFMSYQDVAQEKLAGHWLTWLLSPLGHILISDDYSSEDFVGLLKMPLLVIHDVHDVVIGYDNGKEIFAQANMRKKDFWSYDHGSHAGVFFVEKNRYRKKFTDHLNYLCQGFK